MGCWRRIPPLLPALGAPLGQKPLKGFMDTPPLVLSPPGVLWPPQQPC